MKKKCRLCLNSAMMELRDDCGFHLGYYCFMCGQQTIKDYDVKMMGIKKRVLKYGKEDE